MPLTDEATLNESKEMVIAAAFQPRNKYKIINIFILKD